MNRTDLQSNAILQPTTQKSSKCHRDTTLLLYSTACESQEFPIFDTDITATTQCARSTMVYIDYTFNNDNTQ
jgi:hypothetical protein